MSGTSAGAAKRRRCGRGCGQFDHGDRPCGKPGPAATLSDSDRRERGAVQMRRWRAANPAEWAEIAKRWRDGLRYRVLVAYSQDPPDCACCGEDVVPFLVLDHVDGGGNTARKAEGHRGGTAQYALLVRRGFPVGYRVLCWNCNAALGLYGSCPHDLAR